VRSCERCGSPGKSSDKFCGSCGNPFKASSSAVRDKAEKSDSKKGGRIGKILVALVTVAVIGVLGVVVVQYFRSMQFVDIQARHVFETTTIDVFTWVDADFSRVYVEGAEEFCFSPTLRRVGPHKYQVLCDRIPSGTAIRIVGETPGLNVGKSFIIDALR
jgi:hypothetical protein